MKILIVDHRADHRAEVRRLLLVGSEHYEFTEVELGSAAVYACRAESGTIPDCVLLAYQLPDANAEEVLDGLSDEAGVVVCPVVVMIDAQPHVGHRLLRAGAQDYIGRSWLTPESLTRAVENAIERFEMLAERRQGEEALRESEAKARARQAELETLMDAIPAAVVFCHDPECRQMTGTRGTMELFRVPPGCNPSKSAPENERPDYEIWREGRCLAAEELPMQRATALGQPVSDVELELVFPGGEKRNIFGSALPLFNEAQVVRGCVGVFMDITERKRAEEALRESEERLARAQRAAGVGTWDWHLVTGEALWTTEAWAVFGRTPGEFIVNHANWLACLHPEDRASALAAIDAARTSGKYYDEFRVIGADNNVRWIESRGEFIFDERGQAVRMIGTVLDITQRKRTELELAEARNQLRQHNEDLERIVAERTAKLRETVKDLEEFSYSMVHDMRAPLRSMESFSTILTNNYAAGLDDAGRDYLHRIAASASRMDSLIVDILNYSKVVRGELPIQPTDVQKLIGELVTLYPGLRPEYGDVIVDGPLPSVMANEAGLTQVISNLLDNAIKFVAPGVRPRIRVSAEKRGEFIRLWFEDNGIGIPKDLQGQLFRIFAGLHRPGLFKGTGIGLAIVRKAIQRMGGTVGVESEPGRGSRFWVQLKAAQNLSAPFEGLEGL